MLTSQLETTLSLSALFHPSHPRSTATSPRSHSRPSLFRYPPLPTFSVLSPLPTPLLPLYREISRAYKSSPTPHIIPANYSRKVGVASCARFWDTGYRWRVASAEHPGLTRLVSGIGCRLSADRCCSSIQTHATSIILFPSANPSPHRRPFVPKHLSQPNRIVHTTTMLGKPEKSLTVTRSPLLGNSDGGRGVACFGKTKRG